MAPISPPTSSDAGRLVGSGTPYDCSQFRPSFGMGCAVQPSIPNEATQLLAAASKLLHWQAVHHPPDQRWDELKAAIGGTAALEAKALGSLDVRIVVQNAALRIAIYAKRDRPALAAAALAFVDRIAPTPSELAPLGNEPRGPQGWLGATWKHRDRRGQSALHGMLNQNAKYFRPVLGENGRRAVFSQLFAIDNTGAVHLTPVVGEIEMRASADDLSAACVLEVDLVALACAPPGLVNVAAQGHLPTHFFNKVNDQVQCNNCHTSSTFPIVPDVEVSALVASEIAAATAELTKSLAATR